MKGLRDFEIPFVGLKIGVHNFTFDVNGNFFSRFEDAPISNCDVSVRLEFDKKETLFVLSFFIDGKVSVECDRCLAPFEKEIFGDYVCYVKLSDDPSKVSDNDEIIYISRDESHLDVSQLIYEYIILCLPIQKIGCKNPGEEERCNKEVLAFLNSQSQAKENKDSNDPRWDALRKLTD